MLWMLSLMKKCFQAHNARLIVNKNLSHGNTCIIWDLICKAYDSSMTAELKSQQILTWLAQTQLHRKPNNQACNFLQAAVSGMPNLASMYQTWNINNQSSTEPSEINLRLDDDFGKLWN
jgi:hypothetical protein